MNHIRPIAICVFRHDGKILVSEGYDPVKQQTFYRPLGGMIEFGERGEDTIRREINEELGIDVEAVRYLSMLESIFTFNGQPQHELVLIYDARFSEPKLYDQPEMSGKEPGEAEPFKVVWKRLDEFDAESSPLYPDGLLELLS